MNETKRMSKLVAEHNHPVATGTLIALIRVCRNAQMPNIQTKLIVVAALDGDDMKLLRASEYSANDFADVVLLDYDSSSNAEVEAEIERDAREAARVIVDQRLGAVRK